MLRGIATILMGGLFFALHDGAHVDLIQIGFLLIILSGIRFFASPLLAVLAERELVRQSDVADTLGDFPFKQEGVQTRAA